MSVITDFWVNLTDKGRVVMRRHIVVLAAFLIVCETCVYAGDCSVGQRYKDNGNGTVTDCKSGLVWLKDAHCADISGGVKPDSICATLTVLVH